MILNPIHCGQNLSCLKKIYLQSKGELRRLVLKQMSIIEKNNGSIPVYGQLYIRLYANKPSIR